MREERNPPAYEKPWWISSRIQQECFFVVFGFFGDTVSVERVLVNLPPNYARLCKETLNMDEVTKPGNWRAFRWIEEGLVRLDLHADEKQYYLTNAGAEYCETLLEAYESEPEQMAHIGEVITYLVNNKD